MKINYHFIKKGIFKIVKGRIIACKETSQEKTVDTPNQHFPPRFALTGHGRVEGKVNHSCFNKHLHCQWFSEYYIFKYQQPLVFFL